MNQHKYDYLQQTIGYTFNDALLMLKALTHRSMGSNNNERLEFLGDSIVNHLIAEALYLQFPEADEGQLSRFRATLVRGDYLAEIAQQLNIADSLILGAGERKSGGRQRRSILADTLEALIGAIFLDGGYAAARQTVLVWFEATLKTLTLIEDKDPKTRLQEWLQGKSEPLPEYKLIDTLGADHDQVFQVSCVVPSLNINVLGEGSSRRRAEQAAAATIMEQFERG